MRKRYVFVMIVLIAAVTALGSCVYRGSLRTFFVSNVEDACPERIAFLPENVLYDMNTEIGETGISIQYPSGGYFGLGKTTVANGDGGKGSTIFSLKEEKEECWVHVGVDISARNRLTSEEVYERAERDENYIKTVEIDGREYSIINSYPKGDVYGGVFFRTYIDGYGLTLSVYTYNILPENPETLLRTLLAHIK